MGAATLCFPSSITVIPGFHTGVRAHVRDNAAGESGIDKYEQPFICIAVHMFGFET
jgi:hypothetical protein